MHPPTEKQKHSYKGWNNSLILLLIRGRCKVSGKNSYPMFRTTQWRCFALDTMGVNQANSLSGMWWDRQFHSERLPGWDTNVQLTLSAFSKWCNIITWGNVLSSKWDKFILRAAAFVPSGGEAIKLQGSAGSRAQHMWRERGARWKGLAAAQISASAFCAGPVFGRGRPQYCGTNFL